jgi:hypothetical protein
MTLCQPLDARGGDKWRALLLGNRLRKLAIGEPRRRDARKFHRRAPTKSIMELYATAYGSTYEPKYDRNMKARSSSSGE